MLTLKELEKKFKENDYDVITMTNDGMKMLAKEERLITDIETALRDFKDDIYVIEGVEQHKETGETMIIYRGVYGENAQIKPFVMFLENI